MKIIKHLNIEYDIDNRFSFDSRIFELTKGNNLELLVSLFEDIGWDFYDKLAIMLDNHNIEFVRNDVDVKLHRIISSDTFENFSNGKGLDYVSNEKYTFEEYLDYIKHSQSFIFEFGYFYFNSHHHKLQREYHTIRYEISKETEEINDLREYFESVLMHIAGIVEKEYNKIKIEDNGELFEPLDLSDSKVTDKIAYLYESGIIDFLHKKGGKPHTVNSIASLLSAITGIKVKTIQSAINPFINTHSISKGKPAQSTLNKAKAKIIDLGF